MRRWGDKPSFFVKCSQEDGMATYYQVYGLFCNLPIFLRHPDCTREKIYKMYMYNKLYTSGCGFV
jgi:hypothetical protein